jgi:hypothetical protein
MMPYKKRVDTIRLIAGSHGALKGSPKLNAIIGELNRITAVGRLSKHNGWLLAVLHTTRSLDTMLAEIIAHKAWGPGGNALGPYLKTLANNGALTAAEQKDYQANLVKERNKYMHEAGAMPHKVAADSLLNEMHTCIATVLKNV